MKKDDVLLKKWCFGFGKTKARQEAHTNKNGELQTYYTYPKYRTIVVKISEVVRAGQTWLVKGEQFSSLTGKPKKVELSLVEKNGCFYAPNQKKPFLVVKGVNTRPPEGAPPVGSLITVNKKHAIVTEVGRNELTVWVNNRLEKVVFKPGTIKWHSDKILKNAVSG